MNEVAQLFAKRLQALRKEKDWSQPELGKKVGTSGAIIGRYERAEITPSIEVARKLAKALDVTLDYLLSEEQLPYALQDKRMLERWHTLEELTIEDRERILFVLDSLVRDAKAREAYSVRSA
jgi:transcriptional regulator with XRE-family HTH domain